jgi:hypothetical protein
MIIVEQYSSQRFTVRLPTPFDCPSPKSGTCTGLVFENVPDFRVGEFMYGWESDSIANLPANIKALQYADVSIESLDSIRNEIKEELTASKVELTQDLPLSWMEGYVV